MAVALRPLAGIVANPGADNITRMLDVPHLGQLHGKALSAMGRRAVKSPQQGQSYSYMGMVFSSPLPDSGASLLAIQRTSLNPGLLGVTDREQSVGRRCHL